MKEARRVISPSWQGAAETRNSSRFRRKDEENAETSWNPEELRNDKSAAGFSSFLAFKEEPR